MAITPAVATVHCAGATCTPHHNYAGKCGDLCCFDRDHKVIIIHNDKSVVRGVFAAFLGVKFAGLTAVGAAYTALSSPLIVTPAMGLPIALGMLTYAGASVTGACLRSAAYNLT